MNIEIILSWMLLGIPLFIIADKLYLKQFSWEITLKTIATYGAAIFLFWTFLPWVTTKIQNIVTGTSGGTNIYATITATIIIFMIFGLGWFVVNRWMFKPTKWWQSAGMWTATIIGATLAAVIYLKPGWENSTYLALFGIQAGIIISIVMIAYWKSQLQNKLAIPIVYLLVLSNGIYAWYIFTGINLVKCAKYSDMAGIGSFLIFNACLVALSFIFDRGKIWHERWSYKILWSIMVLFLFTSLSYGSLQLFGAVNPHERNIKAALNVANQIIIEQQLTEMMKTPDKEINYAKALAIINNHETSLSDKQDAKYYLETIAKKAEGIVAKSPSLNTPWNNPIVNGWKHSLRDYFLEDEDDDKSPGDNGEEKTWQTVFEQSYTGQDNEIKIAEAGKDVNFGDKIIITGINFQLWEGGKWVEHSDYYERINKYTGGRGNFFKAKAPKGETITVKSQRLM
ncbi:hypothetical protein KKC83_01795 [Patescibacteria group bacterium]|nr:hypothetical protein [Candidatus Falkowbacteria bacterium]MBU3905573.1 hypothetical protein [Patescibacteria group bacterium]MBU4015686.1 hypothetical protein [Patescibacteria group bacterium]MBU4026258.1 hypothetical protein [Patescibacteria group bacterium]MBU4103186.1 hypothetical protein [Patescibacteria group bacterium]